MDVNLLCFFISHAFRHDADRQVFHEHLERAWPKGGIYRVLEPSRRHHEQALSKSQIKTYLRSLVAQADVVIVVAAQYALRSEWMLYEVEVARRLRKPIVLVRKPRTRCPKRLVQLCSVQPTELDSLRWKIMRSLPEERLALLRLKIVENALAGKATGSRPPNHVKREDRYSWLRALRPISKEWPKAG